MHELMNLGGASADGEDEYLLDTEAVRALIARMREAVQSTASPLAACEAIRPEFARLLDDEDWLPNQFQAPAPESGMGGGIGQWLLFRSGDRSLALFSLVVPAAAQTPVHDHLAGASSVSTAAPRTRRSSATRMGSSGCASAGRSRRVTSTFSYRRATTSIGCGPRRRRPRSRCTCSPTTPGACGGTATSPTHESCARSGPAT